MPPHSHLQASPPHTLPPSHNTPHTSTHIIIHFNTPLYTYTLSHLSTIPCTHTLSHSHTIPHDSPTDRDVTLFLTIPCVHTHTQPHTIAPQIVMSRCFYPMCAHSHSPTQPRSPLTHPHTLPHCSTYALPYCPTFTRSHIHVLLTWSHSY